MAICTYIHFLVYFVLNLFTLFNVYRNKIMTTLAETKCKGETFVLSRITKNKVLLETIHRKSSLILISELI